MVAAGGCTTRMCSTTSNRAESTGFTGSKLRQTFLVIIRTWYLCFHGITKEICMMNIDERIKFN